MIFLLFLLAISHVSAFLLSACFEVPMVTVEKIIFDGIFGASKAVTSGVGKRGRKAE